jgi:hypothetical protein
MFTGMDILLPVPVLDIVSLQFDRISGRITGYFQNRYPASQIRYPAGYQKGRIIGPDIRCIPVRKTKIVYL